LTAYRALYADRNTQRKFNRWQVVINNLQESAVMTDGSQVQRTSIKRPMSGSASSSPSTPGAAAFACQSSTSVLCHPDIYAKPLRNSKNDVNVLSLPAAGVFSVGASSKKILTLPCHVTAADVISSGGAGVSLPPPLPPKDLAYSGYRKPDSAKDYSLMLVNMEDPLAVVMGTGDQQMQAAKQQQQRRTSSQQMIACPKRDNIWVSKQQILTGGKPAGSQQPMFEPVGQGHFVHMQNNRDRDAAARLQCQSGEELRAMRQVTRPASSYWDVLSTGVAAHAHGVGYASPRDIGLGQGQGRKSPKPCSRQPPASASPAVAASSVANSSAQQQTTVKKTLSAPNLLDDSIISSAADTTQDQCRNCGKHS
jgi:hypothetical protein